MLTGVVAYLGKLARRALNALSRAPGWVIFAFLFLGAVAWCIIRDIQLGRRRAEVRVKAMAIKERRDTRLRDVDAADSATRADIEGAFDRRLETIRGEDRELVAARALGPSGVAKAWARYLSGEGQ
jgi:hypothetical protein